MASSGNVIKTEQNQNNSFGDIKSSSGSITVAPHHETHIHYTVDSDVKKDDTIQFTPISHEGRLYYTGSTKDGKPDGQGTMVYKNGRKYDGNWKDDLMHGYGFIIYEQENPHDFYEGQLKNGKNSGQGTMVWKNGATYVGEWKDGIRDGFGKHTFEKESKYDYYEGHWKNGKLSSKGTRAWKNDKDDEDDEDDKDDEDDDNSDEEIGMAELSNSLLFMAMDLGAKKLISKFKNSL